MVIRAAVPDLRAASTMRVLLRAGLRFHLRRRAQLALCVVGVALGVAVVAAMHLAIESVRRGFDLSSEAVFGRVTHTLEGGPAGIDQSLWVQLRTRMSALPAAPVLHGSVRFAAPSEHLDLLGVDPFAETAFRSFSPAIDDDANDVDLGALLTRPGTVLASAQTAARLGIAPGQSFDVSVAGRATRLTLLGLLPAATDLDAAGLDGVLVADIATAQEVLARVGRLSRIDLRVPPGEAGEERLSALRRALPAGVRIERGAARAEVRREMTRAFYLNLRMLSALALLVGLFIIYNAMTFAVVQRRALIGILRAVGVTPREVLVMVLAEAAFLGAVATALGLPFGVVLARRLVALVTRTIDDLYFSAAVQAFSLSAEALAVPAALGVVGSVLAALGPALEATRIPPRAALSASHLEQRARRVVPVLAGFGVCAALTAALLLAADGRSLPSAFAALFALVAVAAAWTPAFTLGAARALETLARISHRPSAAAPQSHDLTGFPSVGVLDVPPSTPARSSVGKARDLTRLRRLATHAGEKSGLVRIPAGTVGAMAVRGLRAGLSRSAVAVAALMVALATTVGVAVMVASFRVSLEDWLSTTLAADVYVALPGRDSLAGLPEHLIRGAAALPDVRHVSLSRDVDVATQFGEVWLKAVSLDAGRYRDLHVLGGSSPDAAWKALERPDTVLVSEPFAWRHRLRAGSRLEVHTDRGARRLEVAAVFRDYSSDRGMLLLGLERYRALFVDRGVSALGLALEPGADVAAVTERLRRLAGEGQQVQIRAQSWIREASLAIFDRTFAITRVLQWLATLVACVGVLSALMALALERAREMAVLRAQGLTRGELLAMLQLQTGAMGLIAGVLSLPLGTLLALVLVHVINRRAFGWSMEFHFPPEVLGQTLIVALAAALLAGLYPAWRMATTPPANALREV